MALIRGCVGVIGASVLAGTALAGQLVPPAGPVAETSRFGVRTELSQATTPGDADSIFRITEPGSYFLTGNVQGEPGKAGIEISASNVEIDLMGFHLDGGLSGTFGGIVVRDQRFFGFASIKVRNGTVEGWNAGGINLAQDALTTNIISGPALVEDVLVRTTVDAGIALPDFGVARRCAVWDSNASGIRVGGGGRIESCVAFNCGEHGFEVSTGRLVIGSVAGANSLSGIRSLGASAVLDCSSLGNQENGFDLGNRSVIRRCLVTSNWGNGIKVGNMCMVEANACSLCGTVGLNPDGAGISAQGRDNYIAGNHVVDCKCGIDVDLDGNVIARNVAGFNITNYEIVAGNAVRVVVAATTGAVVGNAGGASIGAADPWVNLSH